MRCVGARQVCCCSTSSQAPMRKGERERGLSDISAEILSPREERSKKHAANFNLFYALAAPSLSPHPPKGRQPRPAPPCPVTTKRERETRRRSPRRSPRCVLDREEEEGAVPSRARARARHANRVPRNDCLGVVPSAHTRAGYLTGGIQGGERGKPIRSRNSRELGPFPVSVGVARLHVIRPRPRARAIRGRSHLEGLPSREARVKAR